MTQTTVHNMDSPWTSSNPAALSVSADTQILISGAASNRMASGGGALAAFAEFVPGALLDLSKFDELRFWVRANLPADGSRPQPFILEFSYVDQNDAAGEQHRWFVPVNLKNTWEQRRIGIENERRSAINRLRFTCLSNGSFSYNIDEFLAVREEMMADVEQALASRLEEQSVLPGLANVAIDQAAAPGATQIRLPLTNGFNVGNRILIRGGSAGDEIHDVIGVQNDAVANHTTLTFALTDALRGNLVVGSASVTVLIPVIIETAAAPQSFDATPPGAPIRPTPVFLLSLLDAREDLSRTNYEPQRDTFRQRGASVVCSVRAPARAYLADYQIMPIAPERMQELFLRNLVLQRLSMDIPLNINGAFSSVYILAPPALVFRQIGQPTSVYARIYTRLETAVRKEEVWVRRMTVDAAPLDAPADEEEIVVNL
jgi:hypothetical protein